MLRFRAAIVNLLIRLLLPKSGPSARAWEDEGDSHSCSCSQAGQLRYHVHSNWSGWERCQGITPGACGWRPL